MHPGKQVLDAKLRPMPFPRTVQSPLFLALSALALHAAHMSPHTLRPHRSATVSWNASAPARRCWPRSKRPTRPTGSARSICGAWRRKRRRARGKRSGCA
eukprot:360235-Chlamydomonas_euryale.AAC.2